MKLTFISLALFISISTYCQTKLETENWIKEKIEGFTYTVQSDKGYLKRIYKISFLDCSMKISETLESDYLPSGGFTVISTYPIKDLAIPVFTNTSVGVTL